MRQRLRSGIGARAAVLAICVAAALAFAGAAAASCNPGRTASSGNWHVGWTINPPSGTCINGSEANVLVYSPYVYSGATNDTSGWTMLVNGLTASYGQIGYQKKNTGTMYNFTESDTSGGGFIQHLMTASGVGTTPQYEITFSSNAFHYFVNGSNVWTDSNTNYGGCLAEQYGEISNSASQMLGGSQNNVVFSSAEVRRADTGAWYNSNGSFVNEETSWFNYSPISSSSFSIWDKACVS